MRNNRVLYADVLRITAAFAVVVLHTAGIRLVTQDVYTAEFVWAAFFGSAVRWAVPVFIMLSGMLFLKKERSIDIKKLYTKNILRLVTASLFWSYLYNVYNTAMYSGGSTREVLWQALKQTPGGAMHLWFIFVIVGLYIILPFLKRMTDNMTKREAEYFLILNFAVTFLPTTLSDFEIFAPFVQYISKFELSFVTGYVGLFVLGWYIDSFEHGKRLRVSLYTAAVLSFVYMFAMTVIKSRAFGVLDERFLNPKAVTSYFMAAGIFTAAKYILNGKREIAALSEISKYTFGVYLVHEIIISVLFTHGVYILAAHPYIGIPLEALLVFAVSLLITFCLSKLPFGKFIT